MVSSPTAADLVWANKLCCVYTHVQIQENADRATMLTYDMSVRSVSGNTFVDAAKDSYDQICNMRMGSRDCSEASSCLQKAEELGDEGSDVSFGTANSPNGTIGVGEKRSGASKFQMFFAFA